MFVIQPCVCGEMQLLQAGPRYPNGQHGLQPRAPNTRGPPSQFSFAYYTGLPTVPYNMESSHI